MSYLDDTIVDHVEVSTPLVEAALKYACDELGGDSSGHDPSHVLRVFRMAQRLARLEAVDIETVELVAALHDVKDFKFTGDEMSGAREARSWLLSQGASPELAELVSRNIAGISFKGADTPTNPMTVEGMCVQDADRLDAIGAIGIARCFAYGGMKGRPIHDRAAEVVSHSTTESYLNHQGTSINHFYEKLLLLRDRMNTDAARKIADARHSFMQTYLEEFLREWEMEV